MGSARCYNKPYMENWIETISIKKVCAQYRVKIWQCPQFLFMIMGVVITASVLATYILASSYQEPEVAALTVLALSAVLFLIGYMIVRAFEQVAMASKSKSDFISIMSHQLRSPLSAIKWQLNLLLQGPGDISPASMKTYLDTVVEQNERMIRAVNDLLEVNRIEDRDLILRPSKWSLKDLTFKITEEYKKYASAYNVKINLTAEGDAPQVFADEERIKRVVEHLLDNAIRYSMNGGEITVSIEKFGDFIKWKVTDSGRGIPQEEQRRIFEKYFRSPAAARFQTEGSGVGLFISRSIINLSKGDMGFSSEESKGSTFWFTLPTKKPI